MSMYRVVHTGAQPGAALPEERESLDRSDIEFVLLGRCTTPQAVAEAVCDADAALCYGEPYAREVFERAGRLKVVVRYGIGVDTIDLDAATDHGVMVANFPDFCIEEVANHALVLMLDCAKKITRLDRTIRSQGWAQAKAMQSPMGPIHGQTLGLIAFGNIARSLARKAKALSMEVIAYDPFVKPEVFAEMGVESVTMDELLARSDYVSIHVPLTDQTRGMIDGAVLNSMKPSAYLINTSRGPVVNEAELIEALRAGRIAGAGLDVFEQEPLPANHPFCTMDNVVLTPHSASYADATFASMRRRVGRAALTVLQGGVPEFVANPAVLKRLGR
ncbi:MAG TPA: C-terminal binding protein [Chloroflexi bacterium]|jgi:D-3-phosphoglycerate dehydrogenase|nr:C-terminal binding protein [Chloroflexota bacterium]